VDAVLGVSMTPTALRLVLVEGADADGVTVPVDTVDITTDDDAPTITAPERVISAILSTVGSDSYRVTSTGISWADLAAAAALREGLAVHKVDNVMLVPAFSGAAALAQAVGKAAGYAQAVAMLVEMVAGADELEPHPQAVVVVGLGVDIVLIKSELAAATPLPVHASDEPEMTHAPRLAPSTAAGAYGYVSGPGKTNSYLRGDSHGTAILEARNLCKSYGRGATATPILKNIDLPIFPGEFVALIGPSGAGKSTLLSIRGLLEPPTSGDVSMNQQSVARLPRRALASALPGLLAGESGRAQYERAMALLDQLGLAASATRVPAESSGGEQQRVAIARALFRAPDVVLADEHR